MNYPDYLVHFNPNHDPKTGQFTFSKYVNSTGGLTKQGRTSFGMNNLDSTKSNLSGRKATKAAEKEMKQIYWKQNDKVSKLLKNGEFKESYDEALERYENDLENASKNKSFLKDFKAGVRDFF